MGEHFKNMAWGSDSGPVFLGEEITRKKDHSEETARLIDHDIEQILDQAYDRAKAALKDHEPAMHRMAEELLQHEIVLGNRLREILAETKQPEPVQAASPTPEA